MVYSLTVCTFKTHPGERFLIVGTAQRLEFSPRRCQSAYLLTYKIMRDGRLSFLHKTPTDDIPMAMKAFQSRLLVGIGNKLRIYELGKKKLLRKCESMVRFSTFFLQKKTKKF